MTNKELILTKTNDGLDVFLHYLGDNIEHRTFCNPYRGDRNPSCKLYYRNGRYVMYDYGSPDWSGDCFKLVSMISGLNESAQFCEILHLIDRELHLNVLTDRVLLREPYHPVLPSAPRPSSCPLRFSAVLRNFCKSDLAYWFRYGITQSVLTRYRVSSLEQCVFTRPDDSRYTIYGTTKQPFFGYTLNQGRGMKFYRPLSDTRFMYAGELPSPYVFGYEQLPPMGRIVYITGGEKDVMSLAAHGFHAICFNSETALLPSAYIKALTGRFQSVVILYDTDETGRRESEKRVVELRQQGYQNVYRQVLPLAGTKQEKDVSDFFCKGYSPNILSQQTQQVLQSHE